MVVLSATIVTALVKSMFANAMLEVAQEQYVEKFDSISKNRMELSADAQRRTSIVPTDENIQYFFQHEVRRLLSTRAQHRERT